MLSLPRDLAVTIPGYADGVKINQAYDEGGAALTLKTVKHLFESATAEPMVINSVIDVNFNGFQRAVNYVKGVYVDVDRRYYNPEGTGFAAIDIEAGYQRLVGSDALAYVRYRHTDSDIFRNARQQDFLRQAANQKAVRDLQQPGDARDLVRVFREYFRFDRKFMTTQEPRRAAEDRRLSRGQRRAGQPGVAAGDHRVRGPGRRHAAVRLDGQHRGRVRRLHDRREVDEPEAQLAAAARAEGEVVETRERARGRAPRGRRHGGARRRRSSTSRSTSRGR